MPSNGDSSGGMMTELLPGLCPNIVVGMHRMTTQYPRIERRGADQ
jgi:hypothetical protein